MRTLAGRSSCLAALTAVLVLAVGQPASALQAPAPGAVSAQKLKLPDGPASVRGLAAAPAVGIYTGQITQAVPIELPPGPNGFGPKLEIIYSGELGYGVVGIGWALAELEIVRSLRHGVPSYGDGDELELIGFGENGRLVPDAEVPDLFWVEGRLHGVRVERHGEHFLVMDDKGTRYLLGGTSDSRQEQAGKTAAWRVETVENVAGQRISYRYSKAEGHVYLNRIEWGPELAAGQTAFVAELEYEARPDAVVSFGTGFADKTSSRLERITVRAFGGVLRSYVLGYEDTDTDPELAFSRLISIEQFGTDGATALPELSFTYATPGQPAAIAYDAGGWVLNERGVSIADVDGDGMADLLRLEAGNHQFKKARDTVYSDTRFLSGASDIDLESGTLLDLDGDSRPELVRVVDDTWRAYRLEGSAWRSAGEVPGTRALPLGGTRSALADLNGDGRSDVVRAGTGGILVNFAGENGYGETLSLGPISSVDVEIEPGKPDVRFADVNGDGLDDVVWLAPEWMKIFLGRGDGTFQAYNRPPYPWSEKAVDVSDIVLGDLNRDGLLDLVRVDAGHVTYYRGDAEGRASNVHFRRLERPAGAAADSVVTVADLNGNGSLDVIWSSPSGLWALDFASGTSASMLTGIDNGLGLRTIIEYTPSAELAVRSERAGTPWNVLLPVTVPVPTRVETRFADGTPTRVVEYDVRDGFWDGAERRFGGFLVSRESEIGDSDESTLVDETFYHRGLGEERSLRGKAWFEQKTTGTGTLLAAASSDWLALPADENPEIRKAALVESRTFEYEGVATPIETHTSYEYDDEVRPTVERYDGRLDMSGDERIVRRSYVDDDELWVRDKVCSERVLEGDDATVRSEKVLRYGSDVEIFDACSRAGHGWLREIEARVLAEDEDRWVVQEQASYDALGNALDVYRDGVLRHFEYDDNGLFARAESVAPNETTLLRWEATWNERLAQPATLTDPNGHRTTLEYDELGRLVAVRLDDADPHVRYAYDWAPPQPRTTTFSCDRRLADCGSSPGEGWREVSEVTNGAGEPLYTATRHATRFIIDDYTLYDARGQKARIAESFYSNYSEVSGPTPSFIHVTSSSYDALSRLTRQELPNGATKQIVYRAFGQTVSSPEKSDLSSTLDGLSRIVRTQRETNDVLESVRASYDAGDRILSMLVEATPLAPGTSASQAEHRFVYDTLGRLREAEDPDTGLRSLQYDDRNFLVRHRNAAGQYVHFGYDGAGRVVFQGEGEDFDGEHDYVLSYDDSGVALDAACDVRGRLARVREPFGEVKFCYDAFGRENGVMRTVSPASAAARTATERRELAASGLVLRVSHDDGLEFDQEYDGAGRLMRVGDYWRAPVDGDIDASGRVVREVYGNGVEQSYSYDALGLVDYVTVTAASTPVYLASIERNAYGAPTSVSDYDGVGLDHQASYTYDGASRLTGATLGRYPMQYQFSYRYDGLQNMVERGASGPRALGMLTGSYRYGEPGLGSGPRQLTSIVAPGGGGVPVTFQYDAAGRQVRDRDSLLAYNGFDQMVRVEPPPASIDPASVSIVDLGSPSGGYTQATDINASGTVLAWDASDGSPYPGLFPTTAFTFDGQNGLVPLPQPSSQNFPMAINDRGDITGEGGRWEGDWQVMYRYVNGVFEFPKWNGLEFAGWGSAINNAGEITGTGYLGTATRTGVQWLRVRADGTTELLYGLPDPTAYGGAGYGIDDEGEIVGSTYTSAGAFATLYSDAQGFQDLNLLLPPGSAWTLGAGTDINAGYIIGSGDHDGVHRAYRYDRATGEFIDVGIFEWSRGSSTNPSQAYVSANDVNRYGDVVGAIYDAWPFWPLFAYLYTDAVGLVDLNTLVGPEWVLNTASGINDHGEISGYGQLDGQRRAYKLTLAIPRGAGGRISPAIDYTYGYDGFRTSSVSAGDATYWFSESVEERAGRREHYIRVGDRLVAHVTLEEPATGGATPAGFGRFRMPTLFGVLGALFTVLWLVARRLGRASEGRFRLPEKSGLGRSAALATMVVSAACLCSCELLESSSSTAQQALWSQVSTTYLHQGVGKGPALITGPGGTLLEERRYEPFGEPVDALHDGVPATMASLELEPHTVLNKPTDPRTGFSYHGSRWLAPAAARWLAPDPAVKAPDRSFMAAPWDLNPYQYVSQSPTLFWDPDGNRKALTPDERVSVEGGIHEGQDKYKRDSADPPEGWRGGCLWNFCNAVHSLFETQHCGGDVNSSVAELRAAGRAGYTMTFGFRQNRRGPRNVRPANPGAIYQRLSQATRNQPGTYLFTISVADNRHGQLLFMERNANGQVTFTLHDQTETKVRMAENDAEASKLLDSMLTHETTWVSEEKPDQRMYMKITEIYPEPETD